MFCHVMKVEPDAEFIVFRICKMMLIVYHRDV